MRLNKKTIVFFFFICIGGAVWATTIQQDKLPKIDKRWQNNKYDKYFKKYGKRYFGPNVEWEWFKAQAIAESGLKQSVKSKVGAIGIMQIMPRTFVEIRKKNPGIKNIHQPRWNIAAGIFYNKYMFSRLEKDIKEECKLKLAFASYNAGFSRIKKAIKKAKEPKWEHIRKHVPSQTRAYVRKIHDLMENKNHRPSLKNYINKVYRVFSL
jgi:soluble lytic murein transglycosylase-like protein